MLTGHASDVKPKGQHRCRRRENGEWRRGQGRLRVVPDGRSARGARCRRALDGGGCSSGPAKPWRVSADRPRRVVRRQLVMLVASKRRPEAMIKLWSELPISRTREQIADVATLVWVVFWGSIVWQLFQ